MQIRKRKIVFIVNPISGTKSKDGLRLLIQQTIDTARYDCRIISTEYAGHASLIARECVEDQTDICVAV
jgi:diacylglycerol kinase family enzyme